MEAGNVLGVTFDDSSISFFDAKSMNSLGTLEDTNSVTSMPQAGFSFPIDTSGNCALIKESLLRSSC
jgi:mediator of RNA polymerase II transcription subunit 16